MTALSLLFNRTARLETSGSAVDVPDFLPATQARFILSWG